MALMLVVALMLIVNTVRVSAFSRRRETGIMRLVGASGFYIQAPFIMEAAVAGLIGGAARLCASWWSAGTSSSTTASPWPTKLNLINFIGWDAVLTKLPLILGDESADARVGRVLRAAQVPEGVTHDQEGRTVNRPCGPSRCPRLTGMSGRDLFCQPRRIGRGAALTLVFASVLVAGAATGSFPETDGRDRESLLATPPVRPPRPAATTRWPRPPRRPWPTASPPWRPPRRAVSRSGDRWGAVYSQGEYEEFEEALDGEYTGVGLWARRERDGRIEVTRVQPGSPAAAAGIRRGDRLRSVDGEKVDGRPVTEVVSLLRGDATDAAAGTTVRLGLERGTRAWSKTLRRARLSTDSVTVRDLAGGITVIRVAAFTKGVGRSRSGPPYGRPRPPAASSSTCAATPAAWSPRPSPPPPPSSTAAWSPRTTSRASSAPCTPSPAGTPPDPWSRSSTAAR